MERDGNCSRLESQFVKYAEQIMRKPKDVKVCVKLWEMIPSVQDGQPCHLLWALIFLKLYESEHVHASLCGCDESTFRKWSRTYVTHISQCRIIMWGYRKIGSPLNGCFASVDGTDCPIAEPSPFSREWFSYKLRSAGLRYEVGISIESADIVWVSGPFKCGTMNDLSIFRQGMKLNLDDGERVVADAGYRDESCITPDESYLLPGNIHSKLRARHETVNRG